MRAFVAALVLVCALQPTLAGAQTPVPIGNDQSAALDAALVRATQSAPGVSVAIVEDGRIVYAEAAGQADLAKNVAALAKTRFGIGSVTKMITAVCVMQLVEAGKLRLDELVSNVLPDVPHGDAITVRELLRHTSGLVNYGDEAFSDGSVAHHTTPRAILARFAARPLAFVPGTAWGYSNTDDIVLGLIVEKLSGETLAAYERTHVFEPAGMHDTTVGPPTTGVPAAVGYGPGNKPVPKIDFSWLYADGDVFSTASDLARLDIALMNGVLVSPATFALMQADPVATNFSTPGATVAWGLSLTLITVGGTTFVGHHGGFPGFAAEDEMLPDRKFAMIVLGNQTTFITATVNSSVVAVVYPSLATIGEPTPSPGGEDTKVTARLRTLIEQVTNDTLDRTQLDKQMSDAFTPQLVKQASDAFKSYGALRSLTFVSRTPEMGLRAYVYTAKFANGTLTFTYVIDSDGKVVNFSGK